MTTVGEITLIAKIDTSQYKKGTEEIKKSNQDIEKSSEQSSSKTSAVWGKVAKVGLVAVAAGFALLGTRVDNAVKRIDTLVAFPKVLRAMGVSAEDAQSSTDKLSESLRGLPTPLQDGAQGVQRFIASGLKANKATDAFLSMNNALLASGGNAQDTGIVMDSLTRALSGGSTQASTMQAALSRMPTVLKALQSQTGKSAGELYKLFANDPQKLIDGIIKLNQEGGGGMASLEEQARQATGGIGTSFDNMGNAIDRGLQSIVTAIGGGDLETGAKRIGNLISGIGIGIERGLNLVASGVSRIPGVLGPVIGLLGRNQEAVKSLTATILIMYGVMKAQVAFRVFQASLATMGSGLAASTIRTVGFSGALRVAATSATVLRYAMFGLYGALIFAGVEFAKHTFNLAKSHAMTGQLSTAQDGLTARIINSNAKFRLLSQTIAVVTSAIFGNKIRSDALKASNDALKNAINGVKNATNSYKDAQLALKGSNLAVERAQRTYTEAVKQYGPKSLEAREAALGLKQAENQQADAAKRAKDENIKLTDANKKLAEQKSQNKTLNNTADKAWNLGDAFTSAKNKAGDLIGKLSELANSEGGRNVSKGFLRGLGIPGFATGGFTGTGATNEPAGVVHRGEYVIPKEFVNQNTGLPQVGGTTIEIGSITIAKEVDADRFFERLTKEQEIISKGMTPGALNV